MSNSYKNIVITPNNGSALSPNIVFTGSGNTPTTLSVGDNGSMSFLNNSISMLYISNESSPTIFAVNDVSGIPSIKVMDNGEVSIAKYNGYLKVGSYNGSDSVVRNTYASTSAPSGGNDGDVWMVYT